ncbi:hypothetical protein EJ074_17790 [Mesorhizobium sp. M3A.F.Ca.ET.080.04.2.1]|uniref:hypothetical protein n=1 Tax=Mesorhizobium sp. M3A.F.Ca.ET.080.04.2.1 TaxID=2493676 RepID=UPI000F752415|nr:hypothetical protein [Mesorhizobium sp. M3A.F.Ca.ET.080.04.2.1]AZO10784.1 hypothetical protein EJ074_17790 [Mesorhizobium sp. M3A.F.Ca.ET.080.04.2.1]
MQAVGGSGGESHLFAANRGRAMEIHDNALILLVDMQVGRGDVLLQERTFGKRQGATGMNSPRALQCVGISKPDVAAIVVCEIEIIGAETAANPLGDLHQRRTADVGAIVTRQHVGRYQGAVPPCCDTGGTRLLLDIGQSCLPGGKDGQIKRFADRRQYRRCDRTRCSCGDAMQALSLSSSCCGTVVVLRRCDVLSTAAAPQAPRQQARASRRGFSFWQIGLSGKDVGSPGRFRPSLRRR